MNFGVLAFPLIGHLNPLYALGKELVRRGHRVVFLSILDIKQRIEKEGMEFVAYGEVVFPAGSWESHWKSISSMSGVSATWRLVALQKKLTQVALDELPEILKELKVDSLLVDQFQFHGRALAEKIQIPYITVACALLLNRGEDLSYPPVIVPWKSQSFGIIGRAINYLAWKVFDALVMPSMRVVRQTSKAWDLSIPRLADDTYSSRLQIAPLPAAFDLPHGPIGIQYVGSLIDHERPQINFPWSAIKSNTPLVYASFGTLQNRLEHLYVVVAEACASLNVQLVLALGDWASSRPLPSLPGSPVVVNYAPQLELLKKASVCITHAGLNTTIESLSNGVPLISIPITNDQPGVAARTELAGAGLTIPMAELEASRLRSMLERVLFDPQFRLKAQEIQKCIINAGGAQKAADLIELAMEKKTFRR